MRYKKIWMAVLGLWAGTSLLAQDNSKEQVLREMQKLSGTYRNAPYLSFDMAYFCYDEQAPDKYIDSLQGSCKINGGKYWYSLDNTESIATGELTVVLFKEDHIMYLTRPGKAMSAGNPLAMLDSFLLNNKNLTCSVSRQQGQTVLTLEFEAGSPYRKMHYYIDDKTGYITKMLSIVRADQLYDTEVRSKVENNGSYAVIEVHFDHYRKQSFDDHLFDLSRYFKKDGKDYVTVAPYDSYKIFFGSPNL